MISKLRVEKGVEKDRQRICDLARQAHEESIFGDIKFSQEKLFQAFDNTLREPETYLGLKVSLGDEILGFCYALAGGYYIGQGAKVVTVITIATDPEIRSSFLGGKVALRLTHGIELWAKSIGARHVLYHATSGTNPAISDRFFRKLGMTTLGGNYGLKIETNS